MEKSPDGQKTLGQAIDEIVEALSSLGGEAQVTAIRAACEHLKIRPPDAIQAKPPAALAGQASVKSPQQPPSVPVDIRSLKQQKRPSSATEMAAVVAFYLSELAPQDEQKREVDVDDMEKHFKQANFPLPKIQFLLTNAKNAGYFDAVGAGKYRLNAVGYNLVAHNLPRTKEGSTSTVPRRSRKNNKAKGRMRSKQ